VIEMPQPKLDEGRDEFISRCSLALLEDGEEDDADVAEAICEDIWDQSRKQSKPLRHKSRADNSGGFHFVLSTDDIDRAGDRILASGWRLANFLKNPIALFNHDRNFIVGKWRELRVEGNKLLGELVLAPRNTSDRVDEIRALVEADILRSVSVGFREIETRPREGGKGLVFIEQELVETSLCSVPCNPQALAISKQLRISDATRKMVFTGDQPRLTPAQQRAALARTKQLLAGAEEFQKDTQAIIEQANALAFRRQAEAIMAKNPTNPSIIRACILMGAKWK
jgi:HK97 family phage prohead protease